MKVIIIVVHKNVVTVVVHITLTFSRKRFFPRWSFISQDTLNTAAHNCHGKTKQNKKNSPEFTYLV